MKGFQIWLLLTEAGRLDIAGFDALFRAHLDDLLPNVRDPRRRAALLEMREFSWTRYILAALTNAGWHDRRECEELAHDVVVYLLIQPGMLFQGYDPNNSGPMHARFALATANAIRNLKRARARRSRNFPTVGADAATGVADREPVNVDDGDLIDGLRRHLVARLGERAGELLDLRLDGLTFNQIGRRANFTHLSRWGLRELVADVRHEAVLFARRAGDDEFLAMVERLLAGRGSQADQDD